MYYETVDTTEIRKLHQMLTETGIPHEIEVLHGGYHISYPGQEDLGCSVIQHRYSYGRDQGLLEIDGLLTSEEQRVDNVAGWLTAEDVFGRIKAHWEENAE